MKTQGYIRLIHSVDTHAESVLELSILPGEKTPWHYDTLFAETFEIVRGKLQVGRDKDTLELKQGDIATIQPNEKHYYHNVSAEECIIKATVSPANKNFENSLLINE